MEDDEDHDGEPCVDPDQVEQRSAMHRTATPEISRLLTRSPVAASRRAGICTSGTTPATIAAEPAEQLVFGEIERKVRHRRHDDEQGERGPNEIIQKPRAQRLPVRWRPPLGSGWRRPQPP